MHDKEYLEHRLISLQKRYLEQKNELTKLYKYRKNKGDLWQDYKSWLICIGGVDVINNLQRKIHNTEININQTKMKLINYK